MKNPLVSVFVLTYNHEKYIGQALDSVFMQKVNFHYEIVIGEDCSTDNTRNIVVEYKKKYPDKVKLLLHEENIGALKNQIEVSNHCTGKYIAILEGDDYWIDPLKLQKQIDFLEANPDYGMVHTNLHQYNIHTKSWSKNIWTNMNFFQEGDIFNSLLIGRTSMIYPCTATYRKDLFDDYLDDFFKLDLAMGDTFLWLVISAQSKVGYINEATAVRQLLPNSATQGIDYKKRMVFLDSGKRILEYAEKNFSVNNNVVKLAKESHYLKRLEIHYQYNINTDNSFEKVKFTGKRFFFEKLYCQLRGKNRYVNYILNRIRLILVKLKIDYASTVYRELLKLENQV